MKKIILLFIFLSLSPVFAFNWGKNDKPVLFLTPNNPYETINTFDEKIYPKSVFRIYDRIYFTIYVPKGFKSDYIKYQIVKQDDNAHIQGFTRIRNITKRVNNPNTFTDYFTISQTGKYYIQIFDITNLHQWLAIGEFRIVEE